MLIREIESFGLLRHLLHDRHKYDIYTIFNEIGALGTGNYINLGWD